jgi:hypothetical protein
MIRRLALTSGLAVLSACALAPKAQAQNAAAPSEETIMFSATVGSVCTFSDTKAGILGQSTSGLSTLEGGTAGETVVDCTSEPNNITVTAPRQVTAPSSFNQGLSRAFVSYGTETVSSDGPGPSFLNVPAGEATLQVNMDVESNGPLPPGLYEYEVTVTASPN